MRLSHRPTRLLKRNSSRSKIWREMNGFCSRDEFTPSFMTQFWMRHDVTGITPKHVHDIITTQQAVHLVCEHVGVAILTKPTALGFGAEGVVLRPLSETSLCFQTCLIMRTDDDSQLANEFARSFLRRCAPQYLPPMQLELPLSA